MQRAFALAIDVAIVLMATLFALLLRDNFEPPPHRLPEAIPYLILTAVVSVPVFAMFGINRAIWRFAGPTDYWRLIGAMAAIVLGALVFAFIYNRLDGVSRSWPILQFMVGVLMLIGLRVLYRHRHAARRGPGKSAPLQVTDAVQSETVLVVGLSPLTEMYLLSIAEFAADRIRVAGLLGRTDRHVGRRIENVQVLGLPEDVDDVLKELETHGVLVDRIVVASDFATLPALAREALLKVSRSGAIELQILTDQLGLSEASSRSRPSDHNKPRRAALQQEDNRGDAEFLIPQDDASQLSQRGYWRVKRAFDVVLAALLIGMLAPIALAVAGAVALTIGRPVTFWQQRPGLGGRAFRLLKFRSMAPAYTSDGKLLADDDRTSKVGDLLRRTRLDELPQLLNIVFGDMSFVGPRPLLPRDQSEGHRARLLVRPGLTGWAQVIGGRTISADDKAALDVWYVRNASLRLDLEIMLRTVPIILFGERVSHETIKRTWDDLSARGIVR